MLRARWLVFVFAITFGLGGWFALRSATSRPPEDHPVLGNGGWMGGFGILDGERPSWVPALLVFRVKGERVEGEMKGRFDTPISGKLEGDRVRFSTRLRKREVTCEGRREGDFLLGECDYDGRAGVLRLHAGGPVSAKDLAPYFGLYELAPGHRLVVASEGELPVVIDLQTGWGRGLFPAGEGRFFVGPSLAVPYPVEQRLTFTRNGAWEVDGLWLESETGKVRARRCCPYRSEEHTFDSAGTRLAGTLYLPPGEGPFPAAVWVHGSGRTNRHGAFYFPFYLVGEGYAVLAYDKRGVGASGGSYTMPDGNSFSVPFLRRRAQDVLAAVHSIQGHPSIDASRVGLVGVSQAGWVSPIAAKSSDVAFTITLSGGATALSLESKHSRWSGENFAVEATVEDVITRLRRVRPTDYDFRSDFAAQSGPGLWLYGYKDRSNPSQLCVDLLREVRAAHDKDFTIKVYPDGNHALLQARHGGYDEIGLLDGQVPGIHQIISGWLAEKVGPAAGEGVSP